MAGLINLTGEQAITANVNSINTLVVPPLSSSVDVSRYDMLEMEFGLVQLAPSAVLLFVLSSMQNDFDDILGTNYLPTTVNYSWLCAMSWSPPAGVPQFAGIRINQGFYRWIRWGLISTNGTGNVTFWIRGMGRRY